MKQINIRAQLVIIGLMCALTVTSNAFAIQVSPLPTREYAAQSWVGFSVDDHYAIRISLTADGTGSGTLSSGSLGTEPFDVTSWALDSRALALSVHFRSRERSEARLAGRFKQYLLSYNNRMLPHPEKLTADDIPGPLEISFQDGDYRVRFSVWPEDDLNRQLRALREPARTSKEITGP